MVDGKFIKFLVNKEGVALGNGKKVLINLIEDTKELTP